ncbi:MAG: NAD(P)H-hydrate epimerase [Rhodopirellula sp. JB044]|uniref:NAD(P)H-hydrate epimerase n=1 Tax=Rhodopirellula sp. JB044 TaxID=3342844 RepID=UPI00370A7079
MSKRSVPVAEATERNWPVFSVAQSREVDRIAIEQFSIPGIELMRNAGRACADRVQQELSENGPPTLILAGAGNNGGDGYVIARCLEKAGFGVAVISLVDPERLSGDARQSYEDALCHGVPMETADVEAVVSQIRSHRGMIIDALLGTGAKGAPRSPFAEAIRAANETREPGTDGVEGATRVAIDIPSGLDGDTGEPSDPTFRADLTLTFVTPKTGMTNPHAEPYLGEVELIDIGIPEALKQQLGIPG